MPRLKIIPLFFAIALTTPAQQVNLATPTTVQFSDPSYGVTFRYPAKWNSSKDFSFYAPVSITSQEQPLRGNVFFSSDEGFNPYPHTNLSGAQFAYSVRKSPTGGECLKQVLQDGGDAKMLAPKTINGIRYFHAQTADAGMCHQISEDIYAASRNGTCYLFDLAVHTLCAGVVDNTREITAAELAQVHASLEKILSSVEISNLKN